MTSILGLLILSLTQSNPIAQAAESASIAFECPFEAECDQNYDRWPDGWKRHFGPDHPRYVAVEIEEGANALLEDPVHKTDGQSHASKDKKLMGANGQTAAEHFPQGKCLTAKLNGGNITVYSPDIEASPTFSYSFEIWVRAEALKQSRVEVSLVFLNDEKPRKVLQRLPAMQIARTSGWKKLQINQVSPSRPDTRFVRVELAVKSDVRHDLSGQVSFDNLRFVRLPRISFSVNRRFYVFPRTEDVELTCNVSGVDRENPEIALELFDVQGRPILGKSKMLRVPTQALAMQSAASIVETAKKTNQSGGASFAGSVTWRPEPPGYGFYRVRATYVDRNGTIKTTDSSFVVSEPRSNRKVGEFGWSIKTKPNVELRDLATLLGDVGVNWLKYPTWYSESQRDELIEFAKFADRLGTQGITVIGVLDRPPEEIEKALGLPFGEGVAGILSEKQLWGPALDAQMSRLSLMVRHWQLGNDGDESFFGIDDLEEKVADLRKHLEGYGQNTKLTLSWNWLYEPPPSPSNRVIWDSLSFYSKHNPTADELARLLSHPSLERTKSWAVIKPLEEDKYAVEVRARDLVHQMISAKQQNAAVIFIHEPIGENGLIREDGTPGDLLLPWRTAANFLTTGQYQGKLPLQGGSQGHLFTRGEETTLVVWNENVAPGESPVKERVYLGPQIIGSDLWGRPIPFATQEDEQRCAYQEIAVDAVPIFITGIDRGVAMFDITLRFDSNALVTKYGQDEANGITFENHFGSSMKGTINLAFPKTWKVDRSIIPISLSAADAPRREPIRVGLLDSANSGEELVPLIVDLQTNESHRFKVMRRLRVGVPDVEMEVVPSLQDNGDLIVDVQIENKTDKPLSFKTTLTPENRRSIRRLVLDAKPGRTSLKFAIPDGKELTDKQIMVRAVEIDTESPRVINKSTLGPG